MKYVFLWFHQLMRDSHSSFFYVCSPSHSHASTQSGVHTYPREHLLMATITHTQTTHFDFHAHSLLTHECTLSDRAQLPELPQRPQTLKFILYSLPLPYCPTIWCMLTESTLQTAPNFTLCSREFSKRLDPKQEGLNDILKLTKQGYSEGHHGS